MIHLAKVDYLNWAGRQLITFAKKKKTVNFSQFTNGTIYENEADRFAAIFFTNSFM